jgi:hypothetical protein
MRKDFEPLTQASTRVKAHGAGQQQPSRSIAASALNNHMDMDGNPEPCTPLDAPLPSLQHNDSVCVAIPCAALHWGTLLRRALRSVALQSYVHIAKIVIVLSSPHGETQADCNRRRADLALDWMESVRKVNVSHTPAETKLICNFGSGFTRGQNRNLGAAGCQGSEWIAFVDADDEMMPHRIERMMALLHTHDALLGLHSYTSAGDGAPPVPPLCATDKEPPPLQLSDDAPHVTGPAAIARARKKSRANQLFMGAVGPTHHGHVVVHNTVLSRVPQSESLRIGEDVHFVFRAVGANVSAVHTEEELTVYHRGTSVIRPARMARLRGQSASKRAHRPQTQQPPAYVVAGPFLALLALILTLICTPKDCCADSSSNDEEAQRIVLRSSLQRQYLLQ